MCSMRNAAKSTTSTLSRASHHRMQHLGLNPQCAQLLLLRGQLRGHLAQTHARIACRRLASALRRPAYCLPRGGRCQACRLRLCRCRAGLRARASAVWLQCMPNKSTDIQVEESEEQHTSLGQLSMQEQSPCEQKHAPAGRSRRPARPRTGAAARRTRPATAPASRPPPWPRPALPPAPLSAAPMATFNHTQHSPF